jgi:HAD superfamily hydrolase (TIGR01459 family)
VKLLEGITELLPRYEAFLIDQWGVLHDGRQLFPGVKETLVLLRDHGKRVVIATNSSKSAARNRVRLLESFDTSEALYTGLISSAELLLEHLSNPGSAHLRFVVVADAGDEVLLSAQDHRRTLSIADADLVALLSVDPRADPQPISALLKLAAARGLPLWTPSRDAATVTVHGVFTGLGQLAALYESWGGTVRNFGKPDPSFYQAVRATVGSSIPPRAVLAIGDQLGTDIAGATREGFDSLLVRTGAGADAFTHLPELPAIECPTYVLESLRP